MHTYKFWIKTRHSQFKMWSFNNQLFNPDLFYHNKTKNIHFLLIRLALTKFHNHNNILTLGYMSNLNKHWNFIAYRNLIKINMILVDCSEEDLLLKYIKSENMTLLKTFYKKNNRYIKSNIVHLKTSNHI